jgi:hypothetical protein
MTISTRGSDNQTFPDFFRSIDQMNLDPEPFGLVQREMELGGSRAFCAVNLHLRERVSVDGPHPETACAGSM